MLPLGFELSCGKSVNYRFIVFFVFNYDSLPYLLTLFSGWGLLFLYLLLIKFGQNTNDVLYVSEQTFREKNTF